MSCGPVFFLGGLVPLMVFALVVALPIVVLVILLRRLGAAGTGGASPSRSERTSLLRERRDRYQQERTRILGMVDGGQVSAAEAARLLDSVERETTTMACPFCEQDIRVEALKCHHCGNHLVEEDRQAKRLTRSQNKMLAGVCAGLADYTGLDVSLVRILVVLIALATGIFYGLLIYLVAALVMPPTEKP